MAEHDATPMIHAPYRGRSKGFLADCRCGWRSGFVPTLAEAETLARQHREEQSRQAGLGASRHGKSRRGTDELPTPPTPFAGSERAS